MTAVKVSVQEGKIKVFLKADSSQQYEFQCRMIDNGHEPEPRLPVNPPAR